jgi:hypothetical protein
VIRPERFSNNFNVSLKSLESLLICISIPPCSVNFSQFFLLRDQSGSRAID